MIKPNKEDLREFARINKILISDIANYSEEFTKFIEMKGGGKMKKYKIVDTPEYIEEGSIESEVFIPRELIEKWYFEILDKKKVCGINVEIKEKE